MPVSVFVVDAFTSRPFAGNPAAVCPLTAARDDRWMQQVAAEMNLAETAFLVLRQGGFDLRWFTPTVEVDLCGHATLASAHVLWETAALARDTPARFHTKSGLLTARCLGDWIELDFPATPEKPAHAPDGLVEAIGATPRYVGLSRFDYLFEVESEAVVRSVAPNMTFLTSLESRGVIVTSVASTPGVDFVSRFFAPGSGIDEDPVTGSTHCCLAPFWSQRLGRTTFVARQLSKRGGELRVTLDGDRVRLAGQAVTVLRGEIVVAAV